jgi:hypothetical protein
MRIGKIVKSNSHNDYVCQIDGPGEVPERPTAADYGFGTFVRISLEADGEHLVGLVYSTILMNPDFGTLGPRLSSTPELEVFSPDYLNEQAVVVGIIAIGQMGADGAVSQGVPRLAANVNATVETMEEDRVRAFHQREGSLSLAYMPLLLAQSDPLVSQLLLDVVNQMLQIFPEHRRRLAVIRSNMAWKTSITPAG